MRNLVTLILKEIRAFIYSPIIYIVLCGFLVLNGWVFWILLNALNNPQGPAPASAMELFFGGTFFFWFSIILIPPVLTMRLLAEEVRSGTIEMLATAPVTDLEIVLSKYLGSLVFYCILWLPTVLYVFILRSLTSVDMGPIGASYLGVFLIGGVFLSVGLLASSLSRNQVIAAVISFVISLIFLSIGILSYFMPSLTTVASYLGILDNFDNFARGIVDTRWIVYYLSIIVFNLFVTVRITGRRK